MFDPVFNPPRPRRHRRQRATFVPAPTPAGPVLSNAGFGAEDLSLNLLFSDYAMTLASFDPSSITLNDPSSGSLYQAVSAFVVGGFIVEVSVEPIGPSSGAQTLLNVTPGSGIVDADSGVMWGGCSDLVVPFP